MKLSVLFYTYRPGGFDLLVESLKRQNYRGEYELIVVDDWKQRDMSSVIKEAGIPLKWYGRMKKKYYEDTPFSCANVINTGLLQATGDYVVMLQDNSYLNENALSFWDETYEQFGERVLTTGIAYEVVYSGKIKVGDYSVFDPPVKDISHEDDRFRVYKSWVPETFELFYTGVPMSVFKKINGFDERSDYHHSGFFYSLVKQMELHGFTPHVDHKNAVIMVDHRQWTYEEGQSLWWLSKKGIVSPKWYDGSITWEERSKNDFSL